MEFLVPYPYGVLCYVKCHHFFLIWQIAKKSKGMYPPPPDYHTFHKVWLKLDEKCESSSLLKILTSEICNVHRMTQTELNLKSTLHMYLVGRRVPKCHPFRSTISRFQDNGHFRILLLVPILKFQSATIFLIFVISPIFYNFIFPYDCLIYHKVRLRSGKTIGGVALTFEISSSIWSCVNKISK